MLHKLFGKKQGLMLPSAATTDQLVLAVTVHNLVRDNQLMISHVRMSKGIKVKL